MGHRDVRKLYEGWRRGTEVGLRRLRRVRSDGLRAVRRVPVPADVFSADPAALLAKRVLHSQHTADRALAGECTKLVPYVLPPDGVRVRSTPETRRAWESGTIDLRQERALRCARRLAARWSLYVTQRARTSREGPRQVCYPHV